MGRKSDAKERLLEAALDLIWKRSYGVLTIDAICEKAGVKKGSFYYFYDSKSALAAAALHESWYACGKETWDKIFSASSAPLDRISDFMRTVYEGQIEVQEEHGQVLGCPCFSVGSETSSEDEAVSEKAREILGQQLRYFESAIRDAQAEGLIAPGDAAKMAKCLFSFFEGSLAQARIHNDLSYLQSLPETSRNMLVGYQAATAG
ncbi:TetR/AcrR family transcriptional regulator [Luteolibacter yonseiensis]|uniref:TetR/AcrR family transcriptional regulator n=1 Tax=Luteolibacter yonseiensis TaxID=1144680 RepID=A0A934R205_9BACT|nr:TetR/AcrR family transcriptional regulator [Luteolibacter yonseiensis]MBK1815501.1 TetR/AcrR family transcriptional regulator [Luteolibacter yonseiensis]